MGLENGLLAMLGLQFWQWGYFLAL